MPQNKKPDLLGYIPGPYGIEIAVYRDPNNAEESYHDFDGIMDMAGIYGADRDACRAAFDKIKNDGGSVPFSIFIDNGGRKIPKEPLLRPENAIYPTMPKMPEDIPIEAWVDIAIGVTNWRDRAKALIAICASNFEGANGWEMPPAPAILASSLQYLLTATLEHLVEQEIDCLEAAAIYALALHDDWRDAGLRWLQPFRSTWFRDWVQQNPGYAKMAKACRAANPDLPKWIEGGAHD